MIPGNTVGTDLSKTSAFKSSGIHSGAHLHGGIATPHPQTLLSLNNYSQAKIPALLTIQLSVALAVSH